ncbi:MAG: hypothetical protein OJF59_002653 [Cytophagales bacterium]|jgi:sugar O-acyltransferase (sialic acid O-acetyltransferase NeuD family)|nr:acetyltransferase [Bacteroidota bacterium]MBS1981593.1 acetyltransferase [Bacteroidota bacterium]WHZ08899.1 MAG: hypothetical protein OJF59_002653 [Cytophagales bacterium]
MKNILICGAGGFGKETAQLIRQINSVSSRWNIIGFADDNKSVGEMVAGLPVLGGVSYALHHKGELDVAIAIADPHIRKSIYEQLCHTKLMFPSLIHPGVSIDFNAEIGAGSIVCAGVLITTEVKLGNFSLINLGCTLGHDSVIGDFTSLMPSVNVSGTVKIGAQCYVGVGAIILQGLTIGDSCQVGAGAVVTKSFEAGKKILGVPARSI